MEESNDNLEVFEEELGDAPPILPILPNFNAENPDGPKNKIEKLKQDKKLKLDLIETKEKEIENLKNDIEKIDKLIEMYESKKIEQNKIIIETDEKIKNQEKEIKENISLLFIKFKNNENVENSDSEEFIRRNQDIVKKAFLLEDLFRFCEFVFEIVEDNSKLKQNMDIINKKQNILQKRNLFINNEIKSFYKKHAEEKTFTKILLLIKRKSLELYDEVSVIKNIKGSNILMLDEYIQSSKENKILFLNNAIDNSQYEIQERIKKAKESLKNGDKYKAKSFLKEKKYISELLEKYENELKNLQ